MFQIKATTRERLILGRRRKGERQRATATRLGVPLWTYRRYEAGTLDPPKWVTRRVAARDRLTDAERCYLARVRARVSPADLALRLGCSRQWIHQMEGGYVKPDKLLAHWKSEAGAT